MTSLLAARFGAAARRKLDPAVTAFAKRLGEEAGAAVVLFYGSNLRTGLLEGVLDFYVLLPGGRERGIWPRVSYREWPHDGQVLRAKIATMNMGTFGAAAAGETLDTTIWARFIQPSAIAWARDARCAHDAVEAMAAAARTAARLAAAAGPRRGPAEEFWRALFRATYAAELRVERPGRENEILAANRAHFDGLLTDAWSDAGIPFGHDGQALAPRLAPDERKQILRWWDRRRKLGRPLNIARLIKATATFDGAARYAAWKVERHTGIAVEITPFAERHPLLAAPGLVWKLLRLRRKAAANHI